MSNLMVQPWLPRNLILRERVLTADPLLKPELEAKFQARAGTPKPEDFDQIRGLDLQNRNFDYADYSGSSLPKVDLRYASLKQAVLIRSRLDQAQMQSAHLEGADLSKATLTGAKLFHTRLTGADLRIDPATPSKKFIEKSAKALREALGYQSEYQSPQNQTKLAQRIKNFEQNANRPADFSNAEKPMKPCLRESENKKMLPECVAEDALTADQQAFTVIWLRLACESTPVASEMVGRAIHVEWLARPLLEAAKDNKKCSGLAGLSDEDKASLQELASKTLTAH